MESALMEPICDEANLHEAWRKVRANRGGPGSDEVDLDAYQQELRKNLATLRRDLLDESYLPLPLRRVRIPKKDGGERELAIPAINDRVAQRAFLNVMDPIFEQQFLSCSFGYRIGRGVPDAVERVQSYRNAGLDWIVDADIQSFFPSVDHRLLMDRVRERVRDRSALRVIGLWLEAGVLGDEHASEQRGAIDDEQRYADDDLGGELVDGPDWEPRGRRSSHRGLEQALHYVGAEAARLAWRHRKELLRLLRDRRVIAGGSVGLATAGAVALGVYLARRRREGGLGTPQGAPISPLLANIYLHGFDQRMTQAGFRMVRYADDFVICCPSEARAKYAQQTADRALTSLRLRLHPEKTRLVPCTQPFRFLGYEFDTHGAFPVDEPKPARQRRPERLPR